MKILIVGYGSIGQMHARVLSGIGGADIGLVRHKPGPADESGYQTFYTLEDSLDFMPDGVIISNPTSLHVDTTLFYAQRGIRALVEKPVSADADSAQRLAGVSDLMRVAYVMRFSKLAEFFRKVASQERIFKTSIFRSFYLPHWRTYRDYKDKYVARKDLGGGCIRTLSHELDLIMSVYGKPESVSGFVDRLSDLEMDADDCAFFSLRYANRSRVNFDLDFYSPSKILEGVIQTEQGKYQWNVEGAKFQGRSQDNWTEYETFGADMFEQAYNAQLADFMSFISTGQSSNCTLEEAIQVQQVIESLEVAHD